MNGITPPALTQDVFNNDGTWTIVFNFSIEDPTISANLTLMAENKNDLENLGAKLVGNTNATLENIKLDSLLQENKYVI